MLKSKTGKDPSLSEVELVRTARLQTNKVSVSDEDFKMTEGFGKRLNHIKRQGRAVQTDVFIMGANVWSASHSAG